MHLLMQALRRHPERPRRMAVLLRLSPAHLWQHHPTLQLSCWSSGYLLSRDSNSMGLQGERTAMLHGCHFIASAPEAVKVPTRCKACCT